METKKCSVKSGCGKELPLSRFSKKGNGLRSQCKDCIKIKQNKYYLDNIESIRKKDNARYNKKGLRRDLASTATIEELKTIHPTLDFSETVIKDSETKVKFICPIHGIKYKRIHKLLIGQGCPTCSKSIAHRIPFNDFLLKAHSIHDNKYKYSEKEFKQSYESSNNRMKMYCTIHGIHFTQNREKHLSGQIGCPKCRGIVLDTEGFIEKATAVHNNTYSYRKVNYKTSGRKVLITCATHGDFLQAPNAHLSGSGCPECSKTGFNYSKPGLLYVLRLDLKDNTLFKIGITNYSVNDRFPAKELKQITVLYTEEFRVGRYAYDKEQRLLKAMELYKYNGPKILRRGDTEIITENPLIKLKEEFNEKTMLGITSYEASK